MNVVIPADHKMKMKEILSWTNIQTLPKNWKEWKSQFCPSLLYTWPSPKESSKKVRKTENPRKNWVHLDKSINERIYAKKRPEMREGTEAKYNKYNINAMEICNSNQSPSPSLMTTISHHQ